MKEFDFSLPKISRYFSSYEEFLKLSKVKAIVGDLPIFLGKDDLVSLSPSLSKYLFKDILIGDLNIPGNYVFDESPVSVALNRSVVGKYVGLSRSTTLEYLSNNPFDFEVLSDRDLADSIEVEITSEQSIYDIVKESYAYVFSRDLNKFIKSNDFNLVKSRFEKEKIRMEIHRDVGDIYDLVADQSKLILDLLGVSKLNSSDKERILKRQVDILDIVNKERM